MSSRKGKAFERKIARDFRIIFDDPGLVAAIEKSDAVTRNKFLGKSVIRRGEQGKNAHEPDIVAPCGWWFELEDGGSKGPNRKLDQALRDLAEHMKRRGVTWYKAVAICHEKGSRTITATMTLWDLFRTVSRINFTPDMMSGVGGYENATRRVTIDYQDFLDILKEEHERYCNADATPDPRGITGGMEGIR